MWPTGAIFSALIPCQFRVDAEIGVEEWKFDKRAINPSRPTRWRAALHSFRLDDAPRSVYFRLDALRSFRLGDLFIVLFHCHISVMFHNKLFMVSLMQLHCCLSCSCCFISVNLCVLFMPLSNQSHQYRSAFNPPYSNAPLKSERSPDQMAIIGVFVFIEYTESASLFSHYMLLGNELSL